MRNIKYIAVHCSATTPEMVVPISRIKDWHLKRGFNDVGYHFYIRRDGSVELGRDLSVAGAHVKGFNSVSIGVCYEGGLNMEMQPDDNRTERQKASLIKVLTDLKKDYQNAEIKGHRDFSKDRNNDGKITEDEWLKSCPCFDAKEEYKNLKYIKNEHRG